MEPRTIIRSHLALGRVNEPELGWRLRDIPENASASFLEEVSCIEVRIDELHENQSRTKTAETKLDAIIQSIIQEEKQRDAYLVAASYPSAKSRIRTYKALFFKEKGLRSADCVEREIDRDGNSFFLGIAKISDDNIAEALPRLHMRYLSFVMCSPLNSAESAWQIAGPHVLQSINTSGLFMMRFPVLAASLVKVDQSLIRFGYDRSLGNWVHFCMFIHRSFHEQCLSKLERTVAALMN